MKTRLPRPVRPPHPPRPTRLRRVRGMASVNLFSGMVARSWSVSGGGVDGRVELNHNTVTGWHALALDGLDVPGTEGTCHALSSPARLFFDVGGRRGTVTITPSMGSFAYSCRFGDGEVVREDNERSPDPSAASASSRAGPALDIRVPSAAAGLDAAGKRVVYYVIRSRIAASGRTNSVHRRFRDILAAYDAVQAAYRGTPLAAALPAAPSRSASWFVDHFAPAFIEDRRQRLESFLRALVVTPRAADNGDLRGMLGLSTGTIRETSVIFPSGPLGLDLRPDGANTAVRGFSRVGTQQGAAEASGRVSVGDLISKVNGADVVGEPHTVLMAHLRTAGRPLVLHFLGYFGATDHEDASKTEASASASAPTTATATATATGGGGAAAGSKAAGSARGPVSYAAAAGAPAPAAAGTGSSKSGRSGGPTSTGRAGTIDGGPGFGGPGVRSRPGGLFDDGETAGSGPRGATATAGRAAPSAGAGAGSRAAMGADDDDEDDPFGAGPGAVAARGGGGRGGGRGGGGGGEFGGQDQADDPFGFGAEGEDVSLG
uniref:PX domain-containing protein n=1 Tax=Cafeteria roenbergensis TaxID=33653 RepID=A0A6U1KEK4_CAFRO